LSSNGLFGKLFNQGGVACGSMKQEDILAELTTMRKEARIAEGGLSICSTHLQRCRTDVYGLALHNGLPLGSIVVSTRWECDMKIVLKSYEKRRILIWR
jgi:hypothetical protein